MFFIIVCIVFFDNFISIFVVIKIGFFSLQSLLCDPNTNSPLNAEAAQLWNDNRTLYNEKVKAHFHKMEKDQKSQNWKKRKPKIHQTNNYWHTSSKLFLQKKNKKIQIENKKKSLHQKTKTIKNSIFIFFSGILRMVLFWCEFIMDAVFLE